MSSIEFKLSGTIIESPPAPLCQIPEGAWILLLLSLPNPPSAFLHHRERASRANQWTAYTYSFTVAYYAAKTIVRPAATPFSQHHGCIYKANRVRSSLHQLTPP